jgi:hypothetical protein
MIKINLVPGFPNFKKLKFGPNNNLIVKALSTENQKNKSNGTGDSRKHQAFPPLNMRRK